ncbi:MAG TPA: flagella basal body P-ring formation protein FlgA [Bryocella sp.]|nr:flagella basal body P-ring formation protein FlgA [Bryocella sp.]
MKQLALVLTMAASLAFAQQRQEMHYPITEATVANLLRAKGTNVTSSQVHLPMQLTATTAEPRLEIVATHRVAEHELDLEVRCQAAGECLPFDALVDLKNANTIGEAAYGGASSDISARHFSAHDVAELPSLQGESIASPDYLRVGARAVLVIVDGGMRIHLPVVAMDSGSKGTRIRVCTLDRKKIFDVVVVDGGTVQGAVE